MIKNFLIVAANIIITIIIWISLPVITSAHVIGIYESPNQITGRTHYILFRPFSEKMPKWFDFSVPVTMTKTIEKLNTIVHLLDEID